MSRTMAEAQLPKRVDAVKLVDVNQKLSAKIDGEDLPRLLEAVINCASPVQCDVEFKRDQENNRLLVGSCTANVVMTCQRCLGDVTLPIESSFQLGLVFDDEQARHLPKNLEPVEMEEEGQLDLWSVMEDEVLLALPMFPMHDDHECKLTQSQPEPEYTNSDDKRPNPFDVLAKLKQK